MLSYIEVAAMLNTLTALVAASLGAMFVYRLWGDVWEARDIGAVGFFLVFTTTTLFDVWDAAIYLILAYNGGDASSTLPFTVLKPFIHSIEIIAYLLLSLHFRKR